MSVAYINDRQALLTLLFQWSSAGWIRDLDAAFADQLAQLTPEADTTCLLAAALVSHLAGQGHLLLDLQQLQAHPRSLIAVQPQEAKNDLATPESFIAALAAHDWEKELRRWTAVGEGDGNEPLVLDGSRLYLRRYWRHEQRITAKIEARVTQTTEWAAEDTRALLDCLFPRDDTNASEARWQKIACALGARSPFAVITGGPGTGKTTTVIRLLALLQSLNIKTGNPALRIALAAPTGKAAARLNESIAKQVEALSELALPEGAQATIPKEVKTLHRLLGARPDTRHYHYHARRSLPFDMVVVDEASMVDIDMMAALLDALPPHARLVLLGDKDQLASVEAGAVLGNLCQRADVGYYNDEIAHWIETTTGFVLENDYRDTRGRALDQSVAKLRHSFRFDSQSGIGQLAHAVNAGDASQALKVIKDQTYTDLTHIKLSTKAPYPKLTALAVAGRKDNASALGLSHYLQRIHRQETRPAISAGKARWDAWAADILDAHTAFQLLTPLRQGPWGVEALNERIEQALMRDNLIHKTEDTSHWYEGRPVLVTGNDYGLKLMNGDIGITLNAPRQFDTQATSETTDDSGLTLRVAFPDGQGGIRWVLPSRLQRIETVYAMTVHKSQGSEFAHTALVMPDTLSPILTRELIYTAVTRAKSTFTLLDANEGLLAHAIERRIQRHSRLFA
ncbi:exodeoxyribonuclease V subunit alpha [Vreelandella neptunia]|uniref:RecBCD enzyme subunit RecD n=1 Tax=Vreelandella neptunia TaxID=115551 RepID=A0ABZ0YI20_9GAMM|nr:exodeoxyribonuclease V subunit alpha [Halomonas neptunia]MDN3562413.1 exodeoxyribonuclease V subunit alpha [Halomonas neptunia]WQH11757.1 exodeoxyribonuclease V subunit alpha [Halomonas neptunia]